VHLYRPVTLPDHRDFRYEVRADATHMRDGNPMRGIFVASRAPLDNAALQPCEPRLAPPA
jgi:hypothetical protein